MHDALRADLLKPSLAADAVVSKAPYSEVALFAAAFLGGPVAALSMFAVNAQRLGRIRRDAFFIAAGLLCYLAWMFLPLGGTAMRILSGLYEFLGQNAPALVLRLLSLAIFLTAHIRHRAEQRSADLFALKRPNPWWITIGCILVGNGVDYGLVHGVKW